MKPSNYKESTVSEAAFIHTPFPVPANTTSVYALVVNILGMTFNACEEFAKNLGEYFALVPKSP